jgi:hypothetical protein
VSRKTGQKKMCRKSFEASGLAEGTFRCAPIQTLASLKNWLMCVMDGENEEEKERITPPPWKTKENYTVYVYARKMTRLRPTFLRDVKFCRFKPGSDPQRDARGVSEHDSLWRLFLQISCCSEDKGMLWLHHYACSCCACPNCHDPRVR